MRLARTGVLRRADVRALWLGETISELGSAVSSLAIPLVAVVTLHAGAFATGVLVAAAWLPWVVIGLPAGAWVDRLPARRVMIAADVLSAVVFASVPVAAWLGFLTLGQLLGCALLGGCAAVFFQTSYQVFLPSLLDGDELAAANALMHGSQSAARVGGPGLAGLLASAVGAVAGVLLNAVSFLVSAACVLSLPDGAHRPVPRERVSLRSEIAEGARFVARDPYLRILTIWGGVANFALVGYQAVLIVFLVHDVRLAPGTVGLLIALTSVGGVLGAAVAPRLARRLGSARAFLCFELVAAPAALLIPLTGHGPRAALFAVGGFLVVAGVVGGNVLNATWSQTYTPRELRGRVSTCSGIVNYGGIPLGALCAGALASAVGTHDSIWIMTGLLALCPSLLLLSPLRGRREFPALSPVGRGTAPDGPAGRRAVRQVSPAGRRAEAEGSHPMATATARPYPAARRPRSSFRRASAASRSRSVRSGSSSTNAQS